MRPLSEIGDDLYAEPPAAFTAARDGFVAQARQAGDRATATALAAMKRPTQAAWLVNLLALRRPEAVAELVELGGTIRAAQGAVPPAQLRDLSAQRRRTLDAALAQATSLATEAGQPPPTRAQLDEAEATLAAAMADDDSAKQVRAGRVLKALHYSGFGDGFGFAVAGGPVKNTPIRAASPGRTNASPGPTTTAPAPSTHATTGRATADRATSRATTGRSTTDRPTRAEIDAEAEAAEAEVARQRLAAAQQRLAEAERALDSAVASERAANADVERVTDELAALREQLEQANLTARAARQRRLAAERDHESAQRRLRAATP